MRWIPLCLCLLLAQENATAVAKPRSARTQAAKTQAAAPGLPMPKRSRVQADGSYLSGSSFRKTVAFFQRYLKRSGQLHAQKPTTEIRGVTLARFVSTSEHSSWAAIHVWRHRGITKIRVLPRPAP